MRIQVTNKNLTFRHLDNLNYFTCLHILHLSVCIFLSKGIVHLKEKKLSFINPHVIYHQTCMTAEHKTILRTQTKLTSVVLTQNYWDILQKSTFCASLIKASHTGFEWHNFFAVCALNFLTFFWCIYAKFREQAQTCCLVFYFTSKSCAKAWSSWGSVSARWSNFSISTLHKPFFCCCSFTSCCLFLYFFVI